MEKRVTVDILTHQTVQKENSKFEVLKDTKKDSNANLYKRINKKIKFNIKNRN